MNELVESKTEKVLLVRMLSSADVCAIGLPVLRYFQKTLPEAELHFLTFADGAELIKLAEPRVQVKHITEQQWPDDFFLAMESFLGLAEEIIGENYSKIVNLDTTFMPCFLARFLSDAGEPVSGNYLNMSVRQLLHQVQDKSLQADYVNSTQAFMASSFVNMHRLHSRWWQYETVYEGGYPEYYLSRCCGLVDDKLEQSIVVSADKRLAKKAKDKKVIGLCFAQSDDGYLYPYADRLKKLLEQKGYVVWSDIEAKQDIRSLLKMLSATDLMVCKPSGNRWYAQAVDCATLLVSGNSEPALLMPEFATDPLSPCMQHSVSQDGIAAVDCNCDKPEDLVESIESVFIHIKDQQDE
ncbi:MAG: ADP-heptose:LPS heptosyltransferase [Gammaproteobacteria bacterium]